MITVVLRLNVSRKHLCMVVYNSSRSGHLTRAAKRTSMTVNHVDKIRETTADEIFEREMMRNSKSQFY